MQRHWYNDRELFLHGLARSNYVTAITDWFMGFAGKWAELVLYGTVLYSCAELYPGVYLPAGLSLVVFLVQLGALDIGGLSLAKLAKQAREDGNAAGAVNAERLSKWLIGIMLVGVVTVGLEHALPVTLPTWIITSINVLLVVARSICAVLYGRVVHDLKQEITVHRPSDLSHQLSEKFSSELTAALDLVRQEFSNQVSERSQMFSHQLSELSREFQNQGGLLIPIQEAITAHEQALTALAGEVSRYEHNVEQPFVDVRTSIESCATDKPKLRLVSSEKFSGEHGELSNKGFIESYLTKYPEARNAEIIEEATKFGLMLSQSYVSQIRKAVKEQGA